MTTPFDKRTQGQSLQVFADEYNEFINAALAHRANSLNTSQMPPVSDTKPGIVFIRNDSAEDVSQYHYMVVTDLLFDVSDDIGEQSFKAQPSLKCEIYNEFDEKHVTAQVVILQEPIKAGGNGLAMLSGTTQVRATITDENHNCFDKKTGSTILQSSTGGVVSSVAKESGTGEKWAYGHILGPQLTRQFIVVGLEENDIVTCREYINEVEGGVDVAIGLPYLLRRTKWDGTFVERDGRVYEYSDFNTRVSMLVDDLDEEEDQIITPDYVEGDIITATSCIAGGTGVVAEGDIPVGWLDDNRDGKAWALDLNPPEEEA